MLTLEEIGEMIVLHEIDPDLLVEVLEITTEEILERFEDKVELRLRKLRETAHELD